MKIKNFLPNQYKNTNIPKINHNYLPQQFKNSQSILREIKILLKNTDFTLGKEVDKFEKNFAKLTDSKYAIGVNSGTDAIILSLKAGGIQKNDEVITTSYTFYATIGAIVSIGAIPKFVDVGPDYNINEKLLSKALTKKTKAIIPVHWSGLICDMRSISNFAKKNKLIVIEDACHAIMSERDGNKPGKYSYSACYSMHPLKNLNVWGDGGVITTNSKKTRDKLFLLRNHGLQDRNICKVFAGNSRLDTLQAIVANKMLKKINYITNSRIKNAKLFDKLLFNYKEVIIPFREKSNKQVFHIYVILVKKRDKLLKHLNNNNIDAKVHYPIPMHLQPAAKKFGYKKGDFPKTEYICKNAISLPVHEFIYEKDIKYMVKKIREFYNN